MRAHPRLMLVAACCLAAPVAPAPAGERVDYLK